MSDWSLQIPYRERSDPLTDVAEASRELPTDEERAVVRQLVLGEIVGGSATTAGELLDKIKAASPAERRELLDTARTKAGLKSASDIEFAEQHRRRQLQASIRAANAPPPRLAYNESGLIVDMAERQQAAAQERAREEALRQVREERTAQLALAAAEHAEHAQAKRAALREESRDQFPWGLPAGPTPNASPPTKPATHAPACCSAYPSGSSTLRGMRPHSAGCATTSNKSRPRTTPASA